MRTPTYHKADILQSIPGPIAIERQLEADDPVPEQFAVGGESDGAPILGEHMSERCRCSEDDALADGGRQREPVGGEVEFARQALHHDAKRALERCANLDECLRWRNQAEALSAYSRMSKDTELHRMADRIKARAIRRAGELLAEIDARGGKPAPAVRFGRYRAGEQAGMSERQIKTAVRVARVDPSDFEEVVESDKPMSITRIADIGRILYADASERAHDAVSSLRRIAHICNFNKPKLIGPGLRHIEIDQARNDIVRIRAWLDDVEQSLAAAWDEARLNNASK